MPNNFLITGPPRSGKTTIIKKVISNLKENGLKLGGIYCPDIRCQGKRKGFRIVDIETGKSKILAHVDLDTGPSVGKYRVKISNIDDIVEKAFLDIFDKKDVIVIDEIAPMEVYSDVFKNKVEESLDSRKCFLAVIHKFSTSGFIGDIKSRQDVNIFNVEKENKKGLSKKLEKLILKNY